MKKKLSLVLSKKRLREFDEVSSKGPYDCIICTSVVEHVENPLEIIRLISNKNPEDRLHSIQNLSREAERNFFLPLFKRSVNRKI